MNWTHDWTNESADSPDSDPGKDLFAVLFLGFFLISVLLLMSVSPKYKTTSVDISQQGGQTVINAPMAKIVKKGAALYLIQENKKWQLPKEIKRLSSEIKLSTDSKGNAFLMLESPEQAVGIKATFKVLMYLQDKGIKTEIGLD